MVNSFSGQCILCAAKGQPGLDICRYCETDLPVIGSNCTQCALPLNVEHGGLCGQCTLISPPYARTEVQWLYQPPIAQLISDFKYHGRLHCGSALAKIAYQKYASTYLHTPKPDVLTPMPLHWRRYLHRGFNQSEHLAQYYSKALKIPVIRSLKRVRATPSQQSLNAETRKRNLKGAFKVNADVAGKTVALVDDVMTTGASAHEASLCLLAGGAAAVHIWCLARTE